jgi:hypothetical protein
VVSLYDDTGVLPFTLTSYAVEPHNLTPAMDCPYVEAPQPGLPNGGQKQSWMARWEAATAGAHFYPKPYTLYPISYTPIPYTLYPIPYILYPYTLYPIPYTLYPIPCTLYPIP